MTMTEDYTNESIRETFERAVFLTESDPSAAVPLWKALQVRIAQAALFSSNETSLEDITTQHLPLLTLENYMALALTQSTQINQRYQNLLHACDLWESFLHTMERYEILESKEDIRERDRMIEALAEWQSHAETYTLGSPSRSALNTIYNVSREVKIARHRSQQQIQQEYQKLQALGERRRRLGITEEETMEGYDDESLARATSIQMLHLAKGQALEEWSSVLRELPMALMMHNRPSPSALSDQDTRQPAPPPPQQGLKLTHITQMPSGQLQVREEIRETVFRPGWNQPTMSLEELAEREVRDAMERDERQKQAEVAAKDAPRRYDQLVKDEMEDVADLVDASAALDRQWDDWKDENPRGSGNKRGDVGDRNF